MLLQRFLLGNTAVVSEIRNNSADIDWSLFGTNVVIALKSST